MVRSPSVLVMFVGGVGDVESGFSDAIGIVSVDVVAAGAAPFGGVGAGAVVDDEDEKDDDGGGGGGAGSGPPAASPTLTFMAIPAVGGSRLLAVPKET